MINKLIELLKNHDTVTFKLTGFGEQSFKTVEFKEEIQALEKQIPEKVIIVSNLETYCPYCENELIDNYYDFSYCDKCGQKLDWSVEE